MPKAISDALQARGIDVSPNFVSNIKFQMGQKKRGRWTAPVATAAAPSQADEAKQISLSALVGAKKLVQKVGSADAAKRAITAFAQLSR